MGRDATREALIAAACLCGLKCCLWFSAGVDFHRDDPAKDNAIIGADAEQVKTLPLGEFVAINRLTRATLSGRVV